ncbi:MAG: glycosyltransferase family 2 protein [Bacteroidota bacterium]
MYLLFWTSFAILFYTYFGYGIILFVYLRWIRREEYDPESYKDLESLPELSLLIAAYNEGDFLVEKIENSFKLQYPKDKLRIYFVTDGSDDHSLEILAKYPEITVFHEAERRGKMAAIDRVIPQIKTPITVLSDANSLLNPGALLQLVDHFADPKIGAVAGEKKIREESFGDATAGEGFYWKYESKLKAWDAELYSVVGAAGELFALRTELYEVLPPDTLIEDFVQSMGIAKRGYQVAYEADAYAEEYSSASIQDELKRKIRIATGGIQAVVRMKDLLNPFTYGVLTFQYVSHRVLRWTLAPLALIFLFISNIFLALNSPFFLLLLDLQVLFYFLAALGYFLEKKKIRLKALFVPYYFCVMNYAVFVGLFRYMKGSQSVLWEKANRKTLNKS